MALSAPSNGAPSMVEKFRVFPSGVEQKGWENWRTQSHAVSRYEDAPNNLTGHLLRLSESANFNTTAGDALCALFGDKMRQCHSNRARHHANQVSMLLKTRVLSDRHLSMLDVSTFG